MPYLSLGHIQWASGPLDEMPTPQAAVNGVSYPYANVIYVLR